MDKYNKYKNKYIELKNKLNMKSGGFLDQMIKQLRENDPRFTYLQITSPTPREIEEIDRILPSNIHITYLECIIVPGTRLINIFTMIKNNIINIKMLTLRQCSIRHTEIEILVDALTTNTTITTLEITGCDIHDIGAHAIGTMLMTNTTITSLSIRFDDITGEGIHTIATMLTTNTTITQLDLMHNNLRNEGAILIANMLAVNTTLTILNLCINNIGDNGIRAIADALRRNKKTKVRHLYLYNNRFDIIGVQSLLTMLETNKTVEILDIARGDVPTITVEQSKQMKIALDRNNIVKKTALIKADSYRVDIADTLTRDTHYLPPELWDKILRMNLTDEQIAELIEMRKKEHKGEKPRGIGIPELCPCRTNCMRTAASPCPIGAAILDGPCPCGGACSHTFGNPCHIGMQINWDMSMWKYTL